MSQSSFVFNRERKRGCVFQFGFLVSYFVLLLNGKFCFCLDLVLFLVCEAVLSLSHNPVFWIFSFWTKSCFVGKLQIRALFLSRSEVLFVVPNWVFFLSSIPVFYPVA